MHFANTYIREKIFVGDNVKKADVLDKTLTNIELSRIRDELNKDALRYTYSSIVTFADGISGLSNSFYSWPIVKLYYSIFYAFRAILGFNGICLFYIGNKPYSLNIHTGDITNRSGNTHACVMDLYSKTYPSSPLMSQEIDLEHPTKWFIDLREKANYKLGKYTEPDVPVYFKKIVDTGIEACFKQYIADDSYSFAFDIDHASVAFPIEVLKLTLVRKCSMGLIFDDADHAFLEYLLDNKGHGLQHFSNYL
ncbi:hypothetical protein ACE1GQ_001667 [Vibrio fluvialis]